MPAKVSSRLRRLMIESLRLAAGLLVLSLLPATASASTAVPGRPVSTVTITTSLVRPVPQSFLGFSMNVEEMEGFTDMPAFATMVNNILNTNGNGPFVLRLGGTYSDSAYWDQDLSQVLPIYQSNPAFDVFLNQTWINSLAGFAQATGSKVILGVNAEAHDPEMASQLVQAAEQTLPAGSLMAVSVGNEPDDYDASIIPVARNLAWVRGLTPDIFASLFGSYANLLRHDFPQVPLAGPESTGETTSWTSTLLQKDAGDVGLVTSHVYPLNACDGVGTPQYPTLFRYLQNSLVQQTTQGLAKLMHLAQNLGLPYRVTELGSGTCGGVSGVNNTFVTSLWAINQLFSFLSAGLDGVNVHLRGDTPNTAIEQDPSNPSGLQPEPLLYGLAAFASALEPNDVLTQVTGSIQPNVSVWAVYGSQGWHLALVNYTSSAQVVDLQVPASGEMTLRPLSASAPWSTQVTFGGQTISPDGTWSGSLDDTDVTATSGVYPVVLPPVSAAIADVAAAPGTTITAAVKRHSHRKSRRDKRRKSP